MPVYDMLFLFLRRNVKSHNRHVLCNMKSKTDSLKVYLGMNKRSEWIENLRPYGLFDLNPGAHSTFIYNQKPSNILAEWYIEQMLQIQYKFLDKPISLYISWIIL